MAPDLAGRVGRAFFERDPVAVARDLLGTLLVHVTAEGMTSGRIVETEAYGDPADLASHAARLKTGGVLAMSGPAGTLYVYRSYGIHAMFNIVAKRPGETGAVLVRAIEPIAGIDLMRMRRGAVNDRKLSSGPGNLCQALGITLGHHGTDISTSSHIWISEGHSPDRIAVGERIGISRSIELPWRFFDPDSAYVSSHRRATVISPLYPAMSCKRKPGTTHE